tara:strand:- start:17 stop:727 length:711 start_codon:yes stop_codon:yes gene_type:complete
VKIKFALLSTNNHPLINGYLKALNKKNLEGFCIFFDSKNLSDKNINLIRSRVGDWDLSNKDEYTKYNEEYEIPQFNVESHNCPQMINLIKDNELEFLVNAGTPRKISHEIIKLLPKGILNVHPGNLPKYRGQDAPEWALYNNDPIEITAHLMGTEYDNGPKILSEKLNIETFQTYQIFRRKIYMKIFEITALASNYLLSIDKVHLAKEIYKNCKIHNAMPQDILNELIKNKFKSNN